MPKFNVTYDIVTEESSRRGDTSEAGFIGKGLSLREALRTVQETRSNMCSREGVECDSYPTDCPNWVTVYNGMSWDTGEAESRSLHIPHNLSAASSRRIARLLGAKLG